MPLRTVPLAWLFTVLAALPLGACGDDDGSPQDAEDTTETTENGADADADSPDEADAESGADADADSPDEADVESGADADADSPDEADAESGADADADADVDAADVPAPDCIEPESPPVDRSHYSGQNCMTCHSGMGATRFTIAGTLYDDAWGTSRVAGATIEIVGADGTALRLVTADSGNFYSSTPVSFPATVRASMCPHDAPMIATFSNGACNSCHGSGSRIHLP